MTRAQPPLELRGALTAAVIDVQSTRSSPQGGESVSMQAGNQGSQT